MSTMYQQKNLLLQKHRARFQANHFCSFRSILPDLSCISKNITLRSVYPVRLTHLTQEGKSGSRMQPPYGFKKGRLSTMWHSEMQQWLCKIIAKTVSD